MRCLLLTFLSIAIALAQRTGRLNPPHLAEMPLPQRVVSEITGADPMDAAARRMGAFQQLQDIIEELSNGRTAIGKETPDEARILAEYRAGDYEALKPYEALANRDPDFLRSMRRYYNDPTLRQEILTRFFSPALQAQSRAISAQLQSRLAAMRQQAPAFGGTRQPIQTSAAPRQAPAAADALPPLPPDPSILKAKAANVDTKVFGMQLGDRLSIPRCGLLDLPAMITSNCLTSDPINNLVNSLLSELGYSTGPTIKIARGNCPGWMSQCVVSPVLDNRRLIGITAVTDGINVGDAAVEELRAKYGRKHGMLQRFNTRTDTGAKFETWNPFWTLPGLRVEYYIIDGNVKQGLLTVETEEAYQRRLAAIREQKKPKL